ncbi:MAG TPA: class I SAM-dependent methyltransferase [Gemmatimonadaceae bacterium]|nr:class I SAM-dependent methyltransferase [Gemmatimonadaceae bacterium]
MKFADHFSARAAEYARYRPDYPPELFDWLASVVGRRRLAWDCATGNGQAALALASRFETVVASDASSAQLREATPHEGVRYVCATAERSPLGDRSVDLATVAQALHWFDLDAFYREVRRVVVPGGAIAVWSYGLASIEPAVDALVLELYRDTLAGYWPPERRHVDEKYRNLAFPFEEISAPAFAMERDWTLAALLGYLGTWSAVQRYQRAQGGEAIALIAGRLEEAWGDPERKRKVRWPLAIRVGRVEGER